MVDGCIVYQVDQYRISHLFLLVLLTLLDLVVMSLIWLEYLIIKRHLSHARD